MIIGSEISSYFKLIMICHVVINLFTVIRNSNDIYVYLFIAKLSILNLVLYIS